MEPWSRVWSLVLDRPPAELIGALLAAALLALAMTGLSAVARRKSGGAFWPAFGVTVCGVGTAAVLAAVYVAHAAGVGRDTAPGPEPAPGPVVSIPGGFGPGAGSGPGVMLTPRVLAAADADRDGRLSPAEAADAAARFVREADSAGSGSLDGGALAAAIDRGAREPPVDVPRRSPARP